jgi:hypothetical protein
MARLKNMLPASTVDDTGNRRGSNSEDHGQCLSHFSRSSALANFSDVCLCQQKALWVLPHPMASLGGHVLEVVGVGSKPQMSRFNTRRTVTAMADTHARGDRSIGQFIGESVWPFKSRSGVSSTEVHLPIPAMISCPDPQLAPAGSGDGSSFKSFGLRGLSSFSVSQAGVHGPRD